jgi:hypothetical protein
MTLWFGLEWEIAFSGIDAHGGPAPIALVLDRIDEALVRNLLHVNNEGNGWWLASSTKWYRDASQQGLAHNEVATAECDHPDELLRQELAAERLTLRLAELAADGRDLAEVRVSKANVCGVSGVTWGSHENYEASQPVPVEPMLAWLASRIAITGSGGLDVTYPGIRFTLSPRAHFMRDAVNNNTEIARGLHNVGKAVSHGSRHRVHVISGDGNRMPGSSWLRFGATAIAIGMMDAGIYPEIRLADAVAALYQFALDRELAAKVAEQSGGVVGMLQIQRAFHSKATAMIDQFPGWAPQVLGEWERVLDSLAEKDGWRTLVGRLDWPTKRNLFDRTVELAGWKWQRIDEINRHIDNQWQLFNRNQIGRRGDQRLDPTPPEPVGRLLRGFCDPDEIRRFEALRRQLLEVDARYMQLGPQSLFDRISKPSVHLQRLVDGLPADPLNLPQPASGRAAVRARLICEHGWKGAVSPGNGIICASWTRFVADDKWLPLAEVEGPAELTWRNLSELMGKPDDCVDRALSGPIERMAVHAISDAGSAVDSGDYRSGIEALGYPDHGRAAHALERIPLDRWRSMVRLLARAQDAVGLEEAISRLERHEPCRMEWLWESVNGKILLGLAGDSTVPELIPTVWAEYSSVARPRVSGGACWKSHLAVWLIRHGRIDEAYQALRSTVGTGEYEGTSISVRSRIEAQYGEIWRVHGEFAKAREHLDKSRSLCEQARLQANLMDYALTGKARLLAEEGDRTAAYRLLSQTVLPYQLKFAMPSALRTLVLMGRLMPGTTKRRSVALLGEVNREVDARTGFRNCPRVAMLLGNWDGWLGDARDPVQPQGAEAGDFFWGV